MLKKIKIKSKNVNITFALDPKVLKKFRVFCKKEGFNQSKTIEKLASRWVDSQLKAFD